MSGDGNGDGGGPGERRAPGLARNLTATTLVVTAGVLPAFLTGAVAVQLRADLGFDASGLGAAVATFFLAAALTSMAFGRVAERIGPSRSMRASAVLSAGTLLGVAVLARSYGALLAVLLFGGVANALAQPAANLFLSRVVPPARQGLAFAVKQSAIPAATLLGGLAVPSLALTVGWRWAYAAGAVVAVAGGALVPAVAGPAGWRPAAGGPGSGRLRPGPLVVLGAGVGLGAAAANTLGAFVVNAYVEAGIAEGEAGVLAAAGSLVGLAVRVTAGARADRRTGGHLRVVTAMLVLGAVAFGLLATGSAPLMVVATPLAFGAGWGWPGLFNLAIVLANPASPGAATGITQTGTYLGALVGPLGFGALAEHASLRTAWLASLACALLAAAAIAYGRRLVVAARRAAPPVVGARDPAVP